MRILVTGGTGFTGKALVRRLLDQGHEVVALDYKEGLKTQELRDWGAEVVLGSVTDAVVVRRAVDGAEVVHHLAAAFREMNVPDSYYRQVNVDGTRNVLEAAQAAGVRRLIYCSTCGVHGNIDHPPGGEDAPIQPADYYQRTKYEAEPIVRRFHEQGLPTVILRPAAIYGPGDPERFLLIYRRVAGGRFPCSATAGRFTTRSTSTTWWTPSSPPCRTAKGMARPISSPTRSTWPSRTWCGGWAGRSESTSRIPHFPVWPVVAAGHVVEKACRPFGITPPIFPRRVDWYRQNRAFRIDKARRDLGWEPRVGLDEGLRRTAEWYRQEGYL